MRPFRLLSLCIALLALQFASRASQIAIASQGAVPGVAARFDRAVKLQRAGKWAEAEAEYRAVLAARPNYAEAHANLGAVLIRMDRYREAIREYETALKIAPNLTVLGAGRNHQLGEASQASALIRRQRVLHCHLNRTVWPGAA